MIVITMPKDSTRMGLSIRQMETSEKQPRRLVTLNTILRDK